ncbi:Ryanodine receptor 44F [Orchesella cincta]|uniref:Ryanodine receptor 44F n=1 Tax=Orchesella cincta TaxID=48709 RepID=A0A1D2MKN1_ORCCI|nr:Ryanodine receptor 44F [Orchesella cincta]
MALMMNTLGRAQVQSEAQGAPPLVGKELNSLLKKRTSRQNQKAMFEHLGFLLENSNILLSRPSLRGSTPLDVAYSSLMENTELALALREHLLEKVAVYLSRTGLQSNGELVEKGYPDLGWDPVEGERYLDFLRDGLLRAIIDANKFSDRISARNDGLHDTELVHPMPESEEDEDYIDTGAAILAFYCTLVDLLGRCARMPLLSHWVKMSLYEQEPSFELEFEVFFAPLQRPGDPPKRDMPPGLVPNHKQSIVRFLERVYGVEERDLFMRLLEDAFLPDLRAATMLDRSKRHDGGDSEMDLR